jgi:hypothetical protein
MPLAERILLRMAELEAALKNMDDRKTIEREALETALGAAYELTTGDLSHPNDVVARDMNTWLERNKYLAETPDLSPPRGSDPAIAPAAISAKGDEGDDAPADDEVEAPKPVPTEGPKGTGADEH